MPGQVTHCITDCLANSWSWSRMSICEGGETKMPNPWVPTPSMGLVYLPTFSWFSLVNVGKYTIHGWYGKGNKLVGGWSNPYEKYESSWIISPGRGEHKNCLKPPPSKHLGMLLRVFCMTSSQFRWYWTSLRVTKFLTLGLFVVGLEGEIVFLLSKLRPERRS